MMLRPKTWLAAARAAAGYSAPLLPFTSFPAALTVDGQIRRPEELPHVSLIALGGLWRPLGGRQVLAQRVLNPVTVQNATGAFAETLGPFPGGLVRAGMQLRMVHSVLMPLAGSFVARVVELRVDAAGGAFGADKRFGYFGGGNVGATTGNRVEAALSVLSDTGAAHTGIHENTAGYYINSTNVRMNPVVDFSADWAIKIHCQSANETPVNITSVSWSGGVATFVNPSHTLNTGDKTTVAGVSNTAYNGVYTGITRIDANTWSGTLVADPGGAGTGGTSSRISNVISQSYSLTLEG